MNDFNSFLINYKNKKIKNHKNHSIINRLIVLDKRDTCSWKGQLKTFKLESLKLESFCLNWKEPSELGKNRAKLEKIERCWKEPSKVGKYLRTFKSFQFLFTFPALVEVSNTNDSLQLNFKPFNFNSHFLNSIVYSNIGSKFPFFVFSAGFTNQNFGNVFFFCVQSALPDRSFSIQPTSQQYISGKNRHISILV